MKLAALFALTSLALAAPQPARGPTGRGPTRVTTTARTTAHVHTTLTTKHRTTITDPKVTTQTIATAKPVQCNRQSQVTDCSNIIKEPGSLFCGCVISPGQLGICIGDTCKSVVEPSHDVVRRGRTRTTTTARTRVTTTARTHTTLTTKHHSTITDPKVTLTQTIATAAPTNCNQLARNNDCSNLLNGGIGGLCPCMINGQGGSCSNGVCKQFHVASAPAA